MLAAALAAGGYPIDTVVAVHADAFEDPLDTRPRGRRFSYDVTRIVSRSRRLLERKYCIVYAKKNLI